MTMWVIIMFLSLMLLLLMGYPVVFTSGAIALVFGSQIKSCGENSFAVKLSEQVIGIDPQIIPSIMGNPRPSAEDGNNTNFEEL